MIAAIPDMEFLKRNHFSLWIIGFLVVSIALDMGHGLQGEPTWICLGLKSPFIEFTNEVEVLANTSIALNITKDEQALMHQEGLKKLGTFVKPVDLRDSTTGFVKANLTKKIPLTTWPAGNGGGGGGNSYSSNRRRLNPIQEEMDQKQIILLDEDTDENGLPASLTDEDRKFIVPMALKNITPDPRYRATTLAATQPRAPRTTRTTTTTTTTTTARPIARTTTTAIASKLVAAPEFASNIDDLKNHILFLQNLTKHDSNFQSKFVVFPSLQKDKTTVRTTPPTSRSFFRYTPPPTTRKSIRQPVRGYFDGNQEEEDVSGSSKITIVPQVLLLNDQQTPSEHAANGNAIYSKRKNFRDTTTSSPLPTTSSQPTPTTTTTSEMPPPKRARINSNKNQKNSCLRNPDSPKCQRQRRRQELQWQRERDELFRQQQYQPFLQTINNTKRFAVSIEIPDSFKVPENQTSSTPSVVPFLPHDLQILSRLARSPTHHKRRNIGIGTGAKNSATYGSMYYESGSPSRDFLTPIVGQYNPGGSGVTSSSNSSQTNPSSANAYSEVINLNPELCYQVDGMTYGQKKQCVLHTSVMPAISRGARAAIQECQFQFKNRRWNCSTTEDNSVFGPMTTLGSPEMAFIHALAAATVTSFIARACRDGQLASCGCSRGARPKQLHDDWAWGGCGDDLEYAYKFSQDFVDIREKERKRGTRGVGAAAQKNAKHHEGKLRVRGMMADAAAAASAMADKKNATSTEATRNGTSGGTALDGDGAGQNGNETVNRTDNKIAPTGSVDGSNASNGNLSNASVATPPPSPASPGQRDSDSGGRFKPEDLLELQERITKEILNSKLQEKEMIELQEKINREILNSKVFNLDNFPPPATAPSKKRKNQRAVNGNAGNMMSVGGGGGGGGMVKRMNSFSAKARSLMNLHNNEAGRRAVIKKSRITCKCHGVSGSCSLITCWQQLSSIREIGDYLRDKYEEATEVKLNKRGRLQVKDPLYKVPTAHDLVYLDDSPDWCRNNRQLQWPGTHGRICNKTSAGLDGCGILCCGRGYNTKNIVVRERCNCKFHWCCQVKCEVCVKILEEHTCK